MSKKTSQQDPFADREARLYQAPIVSREYILNYLQERGRAANYQELLTAFDLETENDQEALYRRLKAMVRDEQLERLKGGYFCPMGSRILVEGKVMIEKGKFAKTWVLPVDGSAKIAIRSNQKNVVFQGNKVIVSVVENTKSDQIREGRIVDIIEQQRVVVTGRFVQAAGTHYVIPHGKEISQDIVIPKDRESNAKDADIVVVEIDRALSTGLDIVGRIIEVLGNENTPGVEIQAAIRAYELPYLWSEEVLKEIQHYQEEAPISAAHKRARLDLRAIPLVTIDGEDAKDFDDAVYCEKRAAGGWRLIVAIADVSHYVKPKTALDKEAKARGNSVYFPGQVIPMLPEVLSNGLCSLKPNVERLCMVCDLSISATGKITRYAFHEGIMRSHARLTYTKVASLLKGESIHLMEQYADLLPHIQELNHLFQALKSERELRGAIDFETVETRILFNPEGKISRIEPTERNDAHRIIEECMLCANVATARFLKKHKLPGLYRNHKGPQTEKLADLKTFLNALGLSLKSQKMPKPLDYATLLRSVQNRPDINIIQTVLLRSLSQAIYSPDNMGHFGLAYPAYCHFTSPIRRYPDLLIHRQIKTVLKGKWDARKVQLKDKMDAGTKALVELGIHTSMTERRADDATRDAVRWLKCEYIQKHIGEVFEGVISGVTRFGFFVELKAIYIDGLIHMNTLRNDYYQYDPIHHRLLGERTGIQYRLGDFVTVKVAKVDVAERKIDFDLEGVPTSSTPRQKNKSSFSHKKNKSKSKDKHSEKKKSSSTSTSKSKSKPKHKAKLKPKPKAN